MAEKIKLATSTASISGNFASVPEGQGKPLVVALHGGGFSSAYYQIPGFSLLDALREHALDAVFLDRPNYGASSFHEPQSEVLKANATALAEAIGMLWNQDDGQHSGIVLLGHSIGGAIALMIAAMAKDWPLLGVSVSGIGDQPPQGMSMPDTPPGMRFVLPRPAIVGMFFKPGAATDAVLDSISQALDPVDPGDTGEIYTVWPTMAAGVMAGITVPVQLLLAEYEALWETGDAVVTRFRSAFSSAPEKDVQLFANVGHCIEFHPESADYYARVLNFLGKC